VIKKINYPFNPDNSDKKIIKSASDMIRHDSVVAFPTETVYGIGASLFSETGIKKIYKIKNRPPDNPLIAHVSNIKMAKSIVEFSTDIQEMLFIYLSSTFWPGPISFILPLKQQIPKTASAGLNTIAIRMPDNKTALYLIEYSDCPIVAPSANLSGKPSCTNARDVLHDFGENIPLIIDGGPTPLGIESTVLDLTSRFPEILRPGFITSEDISLKLGEFCNLTQDSKNKNTKIKLWINEFKEISTDTKNKTLDFEKNTALSLFDSGNKKPKSPGMKYVHYKPSAITVLFGSYRTFNMVKTGKNPLEKQLKESILNSLDIILSKIDKHDFRIQCFHISETFSDFISDLLNSLDSLNKNLKFRIIQKKEFEIRFIKFNNEYEYAKNYYSLCRKADKQGTDIIFLESLTPEGFKASFLNRLEKSAEYII